MIIKFSNLGSIVETELDLRPLTVIIGPNNTNKTYIAYSLYGLWQSIEAARVEAQAMFGYGAAQNQRILDIDESFISFINESIAKGIQTFKENLDVFFQDSSRRLFLRTDFAVQPTEEDISDALRSLIAANDVGLSIQSVTPQLSINGSVLSVKAIPDEAANGGLIGESLPRQIAKFFLNIRSTFLPALRSWVFSRPFLLPAERNGLVLTYKLLGNTRYKLLKNYQRGARIPIIEELALGSSHLPQGQRHILFPLPLEDFLDFLDDLEIQPDSRLGPSNKNAFQLLADQIENQIQNKNKTIFTTTKLGSKEIKIRVKKDLSIDLYNASSSIKQLAPLLLYLRYRATENDLLIIDEPEMNLHPESQARLLEALGILVNLGVKVLLTTHSPYFMAHLNNLVNGDTENPALLKRQAASLYLKDTRAFLKMDQVSAYEMKRNKLSLLKDEDFGIRWDTLSDVSAEIQQKYFEISEKRMASSNGKKK